MDKCPLFSSSYLCFYNVYKNIYMTSEIWEVIKICMFETYLIIHQRKLIRINSSENSLPLHQIIRGYNMDMPSTKAENIKLWKKQNTYGFPIQSEARRTCLSGWPKAWGPSDCVHPRLLWLSTSDLSSPFSPL